MFGQQRACTKRRRNKCQHMRAYKYYYIIIYNIRIIEIFSILFYSRTQYNTKHFWSKINITQTRARATLISCTRIWDICVCCSN